LAIESGVVWVSLRQLLADEEVGESHAQESSVILFWSHSLVNNPAYLEYITVHSFIFKKNYISEGMMQTKNILNTHTIDDTHQFSPNALKEYGRRWSMIQH
jgi:hypothetical protein